MIRMGRSPLSLVVVAGLVTSACTSSMQDVASPDPSSSPVPVTYTPSPAPPGFGDPVSALRRGQLGPGTYDYLDIGGRGFNVRFTVPAGWTWHGRYLSKGGVGLPDGAAIYFFGGPVTGLCGSLSLGCGGVRSADRPLRHRSHGRPGRPADEAREQRSTAAQTF